MEGLGYFGDGAAASHEFVGVAEPIVSKEDFDRDAPGIEVSLPVLDFAVVFLVGHWINAYETVHDSSLDVVIIHNLEIFEGVGQFKGQFQPALEFLLEWVRGRQHFQAWDIIQRQEIPKISHCLSQFLNKWLPGMLLPIVGVSGGNQNWQQREPGRVEATEIIWSSPDGMDQVTIGLMPAQHVGQARQRVIETAEGSFGAAALDG